MPSYADLPNKESFTETINEIVELKSARKYLYETNIGRVDHKKSAIDNLRDRVANFREVARNLQSAITLENNRTFVTEDAEYISGQIKANASRGDYEIEILELAQRQLLVSELIPSDLELPNSLIEVKRDEENITFEFAGGSPRSLARSLMDASKGAFSANIVRRSAEESYFIIQANQGGYKNRFNLRLDTGEVFKKLKLFEPVPPIIKTLINSEGLAVSAANTTAETVLPLDRSVDYLKSQNVFFKVTPIPPSAATTKTEEDTIDSLSTDVSTGTPKVANVSDATNQGIVQLNGNNDGGVVTGEALLKQLADANEPLLELSYTIAEESKQKIFTWKNVSKGRLWINDINLQAKFNKNVNLVSAKFLQNSQGIDYSISDWWEQLYNTNQDSFTPVNEQRKPTKTKFKFYSIEMEQDGNEVVDLIEGVTLNLLKKKEGPVRFSVAGNDSSYTRQIINFINEYNFTMDLINLYLAPSIEELSADDLDGKYQDKVGMLASEVNVRRMKEKMQSIMQDSYVIDPTERKIYLQEFGLKVFISFAKPYHINGSKIEINEDTLNRKVSQYGDKVKILFRYDENRDFVPDGGFAYLMDRLLTEYLGPTSFFSLTEKSLEREKKLLERSLDAENKKIANYREKLEFDFAKVKQIQEQQKQMNSWFNSMQKN